MSKYHIASVYLTLDKSGIVILSGIPPPIYSSIASFEKALEMEYLAMMQKHGFEENNQTSNMVKIKVTLVRGPKIRFKKDGYFYWTPTYEHSAMEVRASIPNPIYEKVSQDRKTQDVLFDDLERAVDAAMTKCI